MNGIRQAALAALAIASIAPATASAAAIHHVQITAASPSEAVRWYVRHLDCEPIAERNDATDCSGIELMFVAQPTMGSTQGTGVDHIAFSYSDLERKMAELEAVGVRGSGVRLQRFDDGATLRDLPGLFTHGFIFDPWGTRIELVEDADRLGLPPYPSERGRPRGDPGLVSRSLRRPARQAQGPGRRSSVWRGLASRRAPSLWEAGADQSQGSGSYRLHRERPGSRGPRDAP